MSSEVGVGGEEPKVEGGDLTNLSRQPSVSSLVRDEVFRANGPIDNEEDTVSTELLMLENDNLLQMSQ